MAAGAEDHLPCVLLPWDSEFFGVPIARLEPGALDEGRAREALAWCAGRGVRCLYYLCEGGDRASALAARRAGFASVDLRVELQGDAAPAPPDGRLRAARPEDLPALEAIARGAHGDSRFFFDGRFPADRCEALYATWIRKSVEGWAQAVFALDRDGEAAGYITCHLEGADRGRIGLVAVGPGARGAGAGSALVRQALSWFDGRGVRRVSVVTQGRNVLAMKLYLRCGFQPVRCDEWFHRWLAEE